MDRILDYVAIAALCFVWAGFMLAMATSAWLIIKWLFNWATETNKRIERDFQLKYPSTVSDNQGSTKKD